MDLRFPIDPTPLPAAEAVGTGARADILRFERRHAPRQPCRGIAIVTDLSGEHWGERHEVRLGDLGSGGIGGIADRPIPPGTAVTVWLPDAGGAFRRGVVVRCLPCGRGYRVGLAFEQRMAA